MGPKYKSKFQDKWLADQEYCQWVVKVDNDVHSARCKVCHSTFSIGGLGKSALVSHKNGKEHQRNMPVTGAADAKTFFQPKRAAEGSATEDATVAISVEDTTSGATKEKRQQSIINITESSLARKAEILFAVDVVVCKHSFNSCTNKSDLFTAMFTDSEIARKFSCGRTKCTYLVTFGVAPYFKEILCRTLKDLEYLVWQFDESHNSVIKKSQMDLHVRFWDSNVNQVKTRYYNSEFLGKAAAADILAKFLECMAGLEEDKVIQVSMDGPNVNKSFLSSIMEKRKEEGQKDLIDLGTCGLHIIHNSFKHGAKASGWNMKKLLSALYKIFHESPSRRADYERLTEALSSDYGLQFCGHRWVENERVAKRGQEVWPKTIVIVDFWKTLSKSKQPGQGKPGQNTSYEHLCKVYKDPLVPVKLQFFEETAKCLNSFLVVFQTDSPMAPFLAEELEKILRLLCSKFIRKEVLSEAVTTSQLLKVGVDEVKNQLSTDKIEVGFGIRYELKQLRSRKKITDTQILTFKRECCQFLAVLCKHMMENSPLKSFTTRCLRALSPVYMAEFSEEAALHFEKLLMKLVSHKRLLSNVADKAKAQYSEFLETVVKENRDAFIIFKKETDRLDDFLFPFVLMSKFAELAEVFKIVLILSHGQAQVERGFSVNDELLDVNMLAKTLIAQRIVHDHMCSEGIKAHELNINPSLLGHVKDARKRYFADQQERSSQKSKSERDEKLKAVNADIADFNQQISLLEKTVISLKTQADQFSFQAEETNCLETMKATISKSNALKRAATEKQEKLEELVTKKKKLVEKKTAL